ncbi:MAG: low molecular weight phosphotyrosine protein phosphatase [Nitratireductor sp.]|nr:low molecular weight phosphotyrosine protein phosphatase [Nitratireductor sp.]MCC0022449.1 low molecular weight phosphotyrosine protein phosphatase [Nitratireductor sp.]
MSAKSVLFVCLGNICRSPLAEGVFAHHAALAGADVEADSAGTSGWHIGEPPHRSSQAIARSHGIDISRQRGRQVCPEDFSSFDLILGMDAANVRALDELAAGTAGRAQTGLFMEYAGLGRIDVPDPWGGAEAGYSEVFDMIDTASPRILARLLER